MGAELEKKPVEEGHIPETGGVPESTIIIERAGVGRYEIRLPQTIFKPEMIAVGTQIVRSSKGGSEEP